MQPGGCGVGVGGAEAQDVEALEPGECRCPPCGGRRDRLVEIPECGSGHRERCRDDLVVRIRTVVDHGDQLDEVVREPDVREVATAEALRVAIRAARDGLPSDDRAARRERDVLLVGVPELWSANTALIRRAIDLLGAATARRSGRGPADPEVRAFTGAVLGIAVQAFLDASPGHDPDQALDEGLQQLGQGLGL